ncbi:Serine/threonine-protein kinase PknD [compost metagenome]
MKTRSLSFALGLSLLAGCANLPPLFSPTPAALVVNGDASLKLSTEVVPGRWGLQAVITPYTAADIHHVTLTLFKLDGSTELPLQDAQGSPLAVKVSQAQLGQEVAFAKLWRNTTYRIKAKAYADDAETMLISRATATDQIDVVVSDDDRPTLARIKVSLIDKAFDGSATTPGLTLNPGTLTATGNPAISLAQYLVSTFAGGAYGSADGTGTNAAFNQPYGIDFDAEGNLYVVDMGNQRIRKITPAGVVSTLAGSTRGYADDIGTNAKFTDPYGLAVDAAGNLFIADTGNSRIRKITPAGVVSTLAGSTRGYADDIGTNAKFTDPYGLAVDAAGNLFIADTGNSRIRKITPAGVVSTLAGSTRGYADDIGTNAKFGSILDIAIDVAGNLFVTDDNRVRRIEP